jgi:hypothetical protein
MFSDIHVTGPTALGLSAADLIAIVAIVVTLIGTLLTAIGVLVLRQFTNLGSRIDDLKTDYKTDLAAVWRELGLIRARLWGGEVPQTGPFLPLSSPGGHSHRRIDDEVD